MTADKRCGACGDEKPVEEFHRRTRSPDGAIVRAGTKHPISPMTPNGPQQPFTTGIITAEAMTRRLIDSFHQGDWMRFASLCALCIVGALTLATPAVAQMTTTNCTSNSPTELSCTTTGGSASAGTSTTNCSSMSSSDFSCTTTNSAEQEREHQVEIQNEARGAVAIGRGVAGLFHAAHAHNRRVKQERLADLNARFVLLEHDFDYGATLVTAAKARGDTAAVRRLSADQIEMSRQLQAIADTAAKVSR